MKNEKLLLTFELLSVYVQQLARKYDFMPQKKHKIAPFLESHFDILTS